MKVDYAELVLRLKKLEKEYHDCMLKQDFNQALMASEEMVIVSKRIQLYTKEICV